MEHEFVLYMEHLCAIDYICKNCQVIKRTWYRNAINYGWDRQAGEIDFYYRSDLGYKDAAITSCGQRILKQIME